MSKLINGRRKKHRPSNFPEHKRKGYYWKRMVREARRSGLDILWLKEAKRQTREAKDMARAVRRRKFKADIERIKFQHMVHVGTSIPKLPLHHMFNLTGTMTGRTRAGVPRPQSVHEIGKVFKEGEIIARCQDEIVVDYEKFEKRVMRELSPEDYCEDCGGERLVKDRTFPALEERYDPETRRACFDCWALAMDDAHMTYEEE